LVMCVCVCVRVGVPVVVGVLCFGVLCFMCAGRGEVCWQGRGPQLLFGAQPFSLT